MWIPLQHASGQTLLTVAPVHILSSQSSAGFCVETVLVLFGTQAKKLHKGFWITPFFGLEWPLHTTLLIIYAHVGKCLFSIVPADPVQFPVAPSSNSTEKIRSDGQESESPTSGLYECKWQPTSSSSVLIKTSTQCGERNRQTAQIRYSLCQTNKQIQL